MELIEMTNSTKKFLHMFWLLPFAALLSGCNTISAAEYADFEPQAAEKRIMQRVNLTWDVRADASEYCAKVMQRQGKKPLEGQPIACATWSEAKNQCTIVTSPNPTHVVIGHEVRHCFEGNFH